MLLIICSLQSQANSMLGQVRPCFRTDKILPVRYEPTQSQKIESSDEKEIVFKVEETRIGQLLKTRLIGIFLKIDKDYITEIQKEKVESASNKFCVAIFANHTDTIIKIPHILGRVTLLQEAKDKNGIWRPIESSSNHLWCGNTDHGMIELQPNELIEIYPRRYCGNFSTKMRMKFLLKDKIIYSEEYDGFINPEIFGSIDFPDTKFFIDISVSEEIERVEKILDNK